MVEVKKCALADQLAVGFDGKTSAIAPATADLTIKLGFEPGGLGLGLAGELQGHREVFISGLGLGHGLGSERGLFLGRGLELGNLRLVLGEHLAKLGELLLEGVLGLPGVWGRDEGAALEARVLEGPLEPDAELPSGAQGVEGVSLCALNGVHGLVARLAERVEEVGDLEVDDAGVLQAPQEVDLRLIARDE